MRPAEDAATRSASASLAEDVGVVYLTQNFSSEAPARHPAQWAFPPADELPLKYQKNKYYFQYRIDELPEGEVAPKIFLGYSRATFDPEQDYAQQEDLWCLSLETGDKFSGQKWKQYYEIDQETQTAPPRYGLFEAGSVVGVLLDTDRGAVTFYKDGNDLGLAFLSDELKEGEFLPFLRT